MIRQKGAEKEDITVVNETIASLLAKSERIDSVSSGTKLYSVETCLKANPQQWYYRSLVRYRGKEIVGDGKLEKVERCRKRSTQSDKTKILWERFVEDAAFVHLARVRELKRRQEKEAKKVKRSRKVLLPVLTGIVVIGLTVYLQYQLDPKLKFGLPERETSHALSPKRAGLSAMTASEDEKSPLNNDIPTVTKKDEIIEPPSLAKDANLSQSKTPTHVETKNTIPQKEADRAESFEVEPVDTSHPKNTIRGIEEGEKLDVLASENDKKESREAGRSETKTIPAEKLQSKIEGDASAPENPVEEVPQRNENLNLQEAPQKIKKNPGQNRGQESVSQQFSQPENEQADEAKKSVAEKGRHVTESGDEEEKTETLSQEEIRKKIKAILGNSNN